MNVKHGEVIKSVEVLKTRTLADFRIKVAEMVFVGRSKKAVKKLRFGADGKEMTSGRKTLAGYGVKNGEQFVCLGVLAGGAKGGKAEHSKTSTDTIKDDIAALIYRFNVAGTNAKVIDEIKDTSNRIINTMDKDSVAKIVNNLDANFLKRLMSEVMSAGIRPAVRFKAISEIVFTDYNNHVDEMASQAFQADDMFTYIIQFILLKEYGDETGGVSWKAFLKTV